MSKNLEKYKNTYSFKELVKKHSWVEEGIWEILGEDPNCDLGGTHVMPRLEIVSGKLGDVITYAVELSGFWQWGAGGTIKKVVVKSISELKSEKISKIHAEIKEKTEQLLSLKRELYKLRLNNLP